VETNNTKHTTNVQFKTSVRNRYGAIVITSETQHFFVENHVLLYFAHRANHDFIWYAQKQTVNYHEQRWIGKFSKTNVFKYFEADVSKLITTY